MVEHLADAGAPLVVDETDFFAKALHNHGVAGALDVGGHTAARVAQADESYGFHINYTVLGSVSSLATPREVTFTRRGNCSAERRGCMMGRALATGRREEI